MGEEEGILLHLKNQNIIYACKVNKSVENKMQISLYMRIRRETSVFYASIYLIYICKTRLWRSLSSTPTSRVTQMIKKMHWLWLPVTKRCHVKLIMFRKFQDNSLDIHSLFLSLYIILYSILQSKFCNIILSK